MIRYYEKNGVITPKRSGSGNYRYYTDMDIFQLFDAMRYKEWGINISEVGTMVNGNYFSDLADRLTSFRAELTRDIKYKTILGERIDIIRRRIATGRSNIGNYWTELVPEHVLYYLGSSEGEDYNIHSADEKMASLIYSSKYISFFDPYVEYEGEQGNWWYAIRKNHHDALEIPDFGTFRVIGEQLCLCTVIDMGEPGSFKGGMPQGMTEKLNEKELKAVGPAAGIILGRGSSAEDYIRLMQVKIPVESV